MTTVVQNKKPIVVPDSLRKRAGIKAGDRLEFRVSGGIINIIPELPTATEDYTPAQRRVIDARIAEARKGPYHGPFESAEEMIAHMQGQLKKRAAAKKSKLSGR